MSRAEQSKEQKQLSTPFCYCMLLGTLPRLPPGYQILPLIYKINNTHAKCTTLYQKPLHVTTIQ